MSIDNWLGIAGLALFVGFGVHAAGVLSTLDRIGILVGAVLITASLVLRNNPTLFKKAPPPAPK